MEPVTDLASLPVILVLRDIAAVYRISVAKIRMELQNGTFSPQPWATYPYRWRREDVLADLRRPRDDRPHKSHGFTTAARARRQKKASLETAS